MGNKELIANLRRLNDPAASDDSITTEDAVSWIDAAADALEAAETPTTVEWGVNVGHYPDGSISVMSTTERDARVFRSRPPFKRNVGPWEMVSR